MQINNVSWTPRVVAASGRRTGRRGGAIPAAPRGLTLGAGRTCAPPQPAGRRNAGACTGRATQLIVGLVDSKPLLTLALRTCLESAGDIAVIPMASMNGGV